MASAHDELRLFGTAVTPVAPQMSALKICGEAGRLTERVITSGLGTPLGPAIRSGGLGRPVSNEAYSNLGQDARVRAPGARLCTGRQPVWSNHHPPSVTRDAS
jgi:hypothetical protein